MVIKPDISTFGTKNVYRLINKKNLKKNFEKARSESLNESVQIQQYVDGLDVGVMAIVKNKKRESSVFFDQWFVLEKDKFNKVGFGILQ